MCRVNSVLCQCTHGHCDTGTSGHQWDLALETNICQSRALDKPHESSDTGWVQVQVWRLLSCWQHKLNIQIFTNTKYWIFDILKNIFPNMWKKFDYY